VAATDNLLLVTSCLTLLGVGLAVLLRSNVHHRPADEPTPPGSSMV
jgi:hypothetical protein